MTWGSRTGPWWRTPAHCCGPPWELALGKVSSAGSKAPETIIKSSRKRSISTNLAEGCLVALDQLLQGCEGLSGGDVVTAVPVQGLDLVVLHVVASLLEQVFGQTNSEFSPVPNL